jgi:hypothetical protein
MVSVRDDTGALVGALLRGPPGNTVTGVNEWINFKQYSEMIADVLGKKIDFIDESSNELDLGDDDPERNKDNMQMVGWSVEFGYDGHRVDKNVKQPSDLGVSYTLQPIKDWCAKQDWLALISRIP